MAGTFVATKESSPLPQARDRDVVLGWGVPATGDAFDLTLTLTNHGGRTIEGKGWALYFNFAKNVVSERLPLFVRLTRVNGDFCRLEPSEGFPSILSGGSLTIPIKTKEPIRGESDGPSGFYFVFEDESLPHPAVAQRLDSLLDLPATRRFERDAGLSVLPAQEVGSVIPTPRRVVPSRERIVINRETEIDCSAEVVPEGKYLARSLAGILGAPPPVVTAPSSGRSRIILELGTLPFAGGTEEAYRLVATPGQGVRIIGAGRSGVFYGIQTLRSLISPDDYRHPAGALTLDGVLIEDAPRFPYRGLMLDVARNFQPKESVLKVLDLMSFYKLNTLHLHLSDDEGWRLEIERLPELTGVGARRGHTTDESDRLVPSFGSGPYPDKTPGSGHYTRSEFIEILRHAAERHVEVVPEIDMPGHARAAVVAMGVRYKRLEAEGRRGEGEEFLLRDPDDRSVYESVQGWTDGVMDVCRPSTYRFVEAVVDDLVGAYAQAGVRLSVVHLGGDEVPQGAWERSPACLHLDPSLGLLPGDLHGGFVRRLGDMLARRGLVTAGWEEMAVGRTSGALAARRHPEGSGDRRAYVWNTLSGAAANNGAYRLAEAGYDVVLCPASSLYFDLAYDDDPHEPGQHWAGLVDTRRVWDFAPFPHETLRPSVQHRILGMEAELWGEDVHGPQSMEYFLFPKLLGFAERAWAPPPDWEASPDDPVAQKARARAWNEFANRLGRRELPRLSVLSGGVNYRLPPPGAVVKEGVLEASTAFPGLAVRYTTDGGEPTSSSLLYDGPIATKGRTIKLKSFSASGRGSRTSVVRLEDKVLK